MKSKQVLEILRSIKDIRLDSEGGELEIKFEAGWESKYGYVHGSFTQQLIELMEDALHDELETQDFEK